jgi:DNA-directed RNA polymerase subunit RPC12/RpoP
MSVVAIRCPTCGSAAASTANPDEYVCRHCNTRFQITHPTATVISDTRAHHCPICGRPVSALESFRCTECGRADFCQRCVTAMPLRGTERFVCRTCLTKKGMACSDCGDYAPTVCSVCSRRACQKHVDSYFALYVGKECQVHYAICPSCKGIVCNNCTQLKRGVFSTKVRCGKCGTEVSLSPDQVVSCQFCGVALSANVAFCPSCGRARM